MPELKDGEESNRAWTLATNKRQSIFDQFERDKSFTDKTYWSFLNAMTYLQEHPTSKQKRVDDVQIAFENIVGNRANRKAEFLEAVYTEALAA